MKWHCCCPFQSPLIGGVMQTDSAQLSSRTWTVVGHRVYFVKHARQRQPDFGDWPIHEYKSWPLPQVGRTLAIPDSWLSPWGWWGFCSDYNVTQILPLFNPVSSFSNSVITVNLQYTKLHIRVYFPSNLVWNIYFMVRIDNNKVSIAVC